MGWFCVAEERDEWLDSVNNEYPNDTEGGSDCQKDREVEENE
jgi:hypothetical protein